MRKISIGTQITLAAALLLTSCGGGGESSSFFPIATVGPVPTVQPPNSSYAVGGSIRGLAGILVLQNNAGDDLKLSADGTFSFPTAVTEGSAYSITVSKNPMWQFCSVSNGSGKASADIDDVVIACSTAVGQVFTFAGSGRNASINGNGGSASISFPFGVVVEKSGDLLVSEVTANLLRKISPAGDVTTFAGSGDDSSQDGIGMAASFWAPGGLALDAAGNAYVAEFFGNRVRKITPAAEVTTVAGNGRRSSLDGNGTSATLDRPAAVATDAEDNIYVAELGGHVVREITPAGDVTTVAGSGAPDFANGSGSAVSFNEPYGIATDATGNLYVADRNNHQIRKITPEGVVTTLAGSGQIGASDGAGSEATFNSPIGVAVGPEGNVYVADTGNHLLRKVTQTGMVSTLAGQSGVESATDGIGAAATFRQPSGITVDADGTLYVADTYNHLIRKVTPISAF